MLVIDNFLNCQLFLSSANIDFFLFCHQLCYFYNEQSFFHDGKEIWLSFITLQKFLDKANLTKITLSSSLNVSTFEK